MSKTIIRLWIIGSALLALMIAPFLASGDAATKKIQKNNLAEIAAMSQSNRDRLNRNVETFKMMAPAEQQQILAFHNKLGSQTEQKQALETYIAWLGTLEPYQRDRLNQVETSKDRIELMKKIVEEQKDRSVQRAMPFKGPFNWPTFSTEELAKVMNEMERLSTTLSLQQKAELKPLTGVNRYYTLLKFLASDPLSEGNEVRPLIDKAPPVFSALVNKFDQLVEDSQLRKFVNQADPSDSVKNFTRLLGFSITQELFNSKDNVSDSDLRQFFETLSDAEQDRLLNLGAADFQSDLKHAYTQEGRIDLRDLHQLFMSEDQRRELWDRRGKGPLNGPDGGGGFGPPRGRGDGPPPDRDGRFDGDRRFGDRPPRPGDQNRPPHREEGDRPPGPPPEPPLETPPQDQPPRSDTDKPEVQ